MTNKINKREVLSIKEYKNGVNQVITRKKLDIPRKPQIAFTFKDSKTKKEYLGVSSKSYQSDREAYDECKRMALAEYYDENYGKRINYDEMNARLTPVNNSGRYIYYV